LGNEAGRTLTGEAFRFIIVMEHEFYHPQFLVLETSLRLRPKAFFKG